MHTHNSNRVDNLDLIQFIKLCESNKQTTQKKSAHTKQNKKKDPKRKKNAPNNLIEKHHTQKSQCC